jgi:hypothetical protein
MSKILDVNLSLDTAQSINSQAENPFDNAYKAAVLTEGSIYVQGFLAFPGEPYIPIEHSWIELGDRIVDPTLPHLNKNTQELYYFPAHRLSVPQMEAAVEEANEDYPEDDPLPIYGAPPYEYYGDVMLGGADYATAYKEAEAKCRELNNSHMQDAN